MIVPNSTNSAQYCISCNQQRRTTSPHNSPAKPLGKSSIHTMANVLSARCQCQSRTPLEVS
eukprot:8612063-Lingulodinium_polyedra.AAC.1